jgi:hypothetical protein
MERFLVRTIGGDRAVAELLLARARSYHGRRYRLQALLFLLVTAQPLAAVLPRRVRWRFTIHFVSPMLDTPAPGLAYAEGRTTPLREPCEGLRAP